MAKKIRRAGVRPRYATPKTARVKDGLDPSRLNPDSVAKIAKEGETQSVLSEREVLMAGGDAYNSHALILKDPSNWDVGDISGKRFIDRKTTDVPHGPAYNLAVGHGSDIAKMRGKSMTIYSDGKRFTDPYDEDSEHPAAPQPTSNAELKYAFKGSPLQFREHMADLMEAERQAHESAEDIQRGAY